MSFHALFQAQNGTRVESPTLHKLFSHMKESKDSYPQWCWASGLKSMTVHTHLTTDTPSQNVVIEKENYLLFDP
jgi:hypothetical protein